MLHFWLTHSGYSGAGDLPDSKYMIISWLFIKWAAVVSFTCLLANTINVTDTVATTC